MRTVCGMRPGRTQVAPKVRAAAQKIDSVPFYFAPLRRARVPRARRSLERRTPHQKPQSHRLIKNYYFCLQTKYDPHLQQNDAKMLRLNRFKILNRRIQQIIKYRSFV